MEEQLKSSAYNLLRMATDDSSAEFRPGQLSAIEQLVIDRNRLLEVQATGWGKSMVYFIVTSLMRGQGAGPTILISPLLSLMRNQIVAAERLRLNAVTINSSNTDEWPQIERRIREGDVDLLFVSPERLANEEFRENVLQDLMQEVGLFVIDEAHCISDWGHDFRPDYQRIVRVLQALPSNIPVLATTATANNRVIKDIMEQLGDSLKVQRGSLTRSSLALQNISLPDKAARMAWLAEHVPNLPGSGIIYVLTTRDAERVAEWLRTKGIDAHAYWAGLDNNGSRTREELESRLTNNDIKALVATVALGMGFDKPDLGFVIHFQCPQSVIHYYQQVGRAGRAIDKAYGVLLTGSEDRDITDYFIESAFPPEEHAAVVLDALEGSESGMSATMLQSQVNLRAGQISKVLKLLAVASPSPVSKQGYRWFRNPVQYRPDYEKIEKITAQRKREQEHMLKDYVFCDSCLMEYLSNKLDDTDTRACGRCAVCRGENILPDSYDEGLVVEAVEFLNHVDIPIEPRKRWPGDALLTSNGWQYTYGDVPKKLK